MLFTVFDVYYDMVLYRLFVTTLAFLLIKYVVKTI